MRSEYDGYRLRVERNGKCVRLITRGGYGWTKRFPWIRMPALARRIAPMITTTKNASTMPWTMANGGSAGGTLGASAGSAGTFRKSGAGDGHGIVPHAR